MRKLLTAAVAAATLAGGVVGAASPADAQMRGHGGWHGGGGGWHGGGGGGWHGGGGWRGGGWHGGGYGYRGGYYRGGYGWGYPLAAGVAGLALGAALADNYYSPGYYAPGYYGYPGYAYPAYGSCGGYWSWDPYYHRNVWVGAPC